ncbi:MAG: UDP-N-acetylmuramate dehydrogenase [Lachnospiraceae bacterium]|nr:UDP-N-acetylmuramate dehydrogenase [Lachnospiraceae bacterium]
MTDSSKMLTLLQHAVGEKTVCEQESMKKHTTFRIGGPADLFAMPTTLEEVCQIVRICREQEYPFYVIGNGSNLLVPDAGYRGLVLQLYKNFSRIEVNDKAVCVSENEDSDHSFQGGSSLKEDPESCVITAQAGAMLSVIAKRALEAGLTGFEFASGIPGTLGGAVVMNAGAYGGEMKQVLVSATVLTREGEVREIPVSGLELGYRKSAVLPNGWIVLGARLALRKGNPDEIRTRMDELKEQRVSKQPLDLPSAGSTFKRPEGYFAGKLIMDAGLKGYTVGGAQVSEKHCGFVVNRGGATAADVLQLIADVTERVKTRFGVTLEPEIRILM